MTSILPTTVPTKRLSASITSSSMAFSLNNIQGWDGNNLAAADFGTNAYGVFRNPENTQMELFEWDPSTIASGSITILRRGMKFNGDTTTEVSGNKLTWIRNETLVELGTDAPQFFRAFVDIFNDTSIAGVKTFTVVPASTAAPVSANDLVNKAYVDALALGGATTVDKLIAAATAGETVAAGNLLYFDLTDNEWKKTDADTASIVEDVKLGIAQGAGTDGNAITGGILLAGIDTHQSGMTQGDLQYAGNTAGAISSSTGTTERVIGIARSATNLFFDPDFYYTLKAGQKGALAGLAGTPSATNPFVTSSSLSGVVLPYAGSAAPTGFLLCDGSAVSRSTYATLFGVISTVYGLGDGSTTFNVPDLRQRSIHGYYVSATSLVVEDCEDAWNESLGAGVSTSVDSGDFKVGSNSATFDVPSGLAGNAIIATEVISKDIHPYNTISFWIKPSIAVAASDLQLLLDDSVNCGSPLESLNIPALIANQWNYVQLTLTAASSDTALISIGFKQITDLGAFTFKVDDVRCNTFNYVGAVGGEITHTLVTNEIPSHNHTYTPPSASAGTGGSPGGNNAAGPGTNTGDTGGGASHNNLPPFITMNYIIKT